MKLVWLRQAVRSRERQLDHIAEHNPAAAARIEQIIVDAVRHLTDHPHMGRIGRVRGTRELVIPRTPFIIVYEVEGGAIRVIRVPHAAQRWPTLR